jgi:hypothetical protein
MQSALSILDYITLSIAIWGAVLSTILAIRSLQKDKRQIRVTCIFKEQTISQDGVPTNIIVGIKAVNVGHRNVRIDYAGLITNSGKYYVSNTSLLPVTLSDADTVTIGIKLDEAEKQLREFSPSELYVSAYMKDTEGNFYKTFRFPDVMADRKMVKQSWRSIKRKRL